MQTFETNQIPFAFLDIFKSVIRGGDSRIFITSLVDTRLKTQRLIKKDAIKEVVKVNGQGYSKDPFHSVTVVFEPC